MLVDGRAALYVERGGRTLTPFAGLDDADREAAVAALVDAVRRGIVKRLGLERIAGAAAHGSPWEPPLLAAGFRAGPKRLSLD